MRHPTDVSANKADRWTRTCTKATWRRSLPGDREGADGAPESLNLASSTSALLDLVRGNRFQLCNKLTTRNLDVMRSLRA